MAATKYTYSISGDFPNQKVNSTILTKEIEGSAIVTALDYIFTSGDECDIWFDDALSGGDQTILDGLVAAHQGTDTTDAPQTVTSEEESISTTTEYRDKINSTLDPVTGGTYRVAWSYEVKTSNSSSTRIETRIEVDGIEYCTDNWIKNRWRYSSGEAYIEFNSGDTPQVKLQFKAQGRQGAAYIRRATIVLMERD